MGDVDTTFIHIRRAQIFAEIYHEFGPVEAGQWIIDNVPKNEREHIHQYLEKELKKYEPITD